MTFKKQDFVEINFTGKTKDNTIFDSNIEKDIKEGSLKSPSKPFVFCLGEGMFLKGIEDFLIGKDVGEYSVELEAKDAFGLRDSKQVQIVPIKVFTAQKINPYQGLVLNFDGKMGKVLSVSGGRVIVDFNHVLAGKDVTYKIEVLRKLEKKEEKTKSLINFFLRQDFPFEIKDKKLILKAPEQAGKFLILFKDKFKEILDLDLEVEEEKSAEKKEVPKVEKKAEEVSKEEVKKE